MLTLLENFLDILSRYGFPLVAAALFLIYIPLALRNLWREYRRLANRHHDLLAETARLLEINALESEIARQAIDTTLQRLQGIREKLDAITELVDSHEKKPRPEPGSEFSE